MQLERPKPELSPREQQLLKYASEGLTDCAIAQELGISEATVGTYWGRVRIKLGPYSRTELVATVMRAERESAVEALRLENEHLVEEIRALGRSDTAFYKSLLENAPDATILVSENGHIEYANLAALEMFGHAKEEMQAMNIVMLIPQRFRAKHVEHRQEYLQDPQRRQMGSHLETPALHKDGSEFLIRAALSAISTPTGIVVMCALRTA